MIAAAIAMTATFATRGTATSFDGVSIRYDSVGSGRTAVVLVHCWSSDRHLWDAQVPALARDHRVVALDLAGHGESGRDRKAWTIEAFGEDVAAVVKALSLDRVVIVGHSMGGPVILEAARRLRGRVLGLVPVDTLHDVESRHTREEIDAFMAPFLVDYRAAAAQYVKDFMFVPTSAPKLVERMVLEAQTAPPEIAVAAMRSSFSYDAASAFETITVPIHAINGDKYPTSLEGNRRHAPQYRLTIMKGVGHYLMLERPEEFGRILRETLGTLAPPPVAEPPP